MDSTNIVPNSRIGYQIIAANGPAVKLVADCLAAEMVFA
jgi:hypothetical protein